MQNLVHNNFSIQANNQLEHIMGKHPKSQQQQKPKQQQQQQKRQNKKQKTKNKKQQPLKKIIKNNVTLSERYISQPK